MPDNKLICDHCGEEMSRGNGGWFQGADDTSECPKNEGGHEVNGKIQ